MLITSSRRTAICLLVARGLVNRYGSTIPTIISINSTTKGQLLSHSYVSLFFNLHNINNKLGNYSKISFNRFSATINELLLDAI